MYWLISDNIISSLRLQTQTQWIGRIQSSGHRQLSVLKEMPKRGFEVCPLYLPSWQDLEPMPHTVLSFLLAFENIIFITGVYLVHGKLLFIIFLMLYFTF